MVSLSALLLVYHYNTTSFSYSTEYYNYVLFGTALILTLLIYSIIITIVSDTFMADTSFCYTAVCPPGSPAPYLLPCLLPSPSFTFSLPPLFSPCLDQDDLVKREM